MPGNCGTEARSFRNSTDWFREESYFSIAAASTEQTERAVKTRTCLCQSCHALFSIMKNQVEELTRVGLRAFAIGLGDEIGEKTFNRVSIFIAFC